MVLFSRGEQQYGESGWLEKSLYGLPKDFPIFNTGSALFGLNCDLELRNCEFRRNGGPEFEKTSSTITYAASAHNLKATDCIFEENIGDTSGGALDISGRGKGEWGAIFQRCLFRANEAHARKKQAVR